MMIINKTLFYDGEENDLRRADTGLKVFYPLCDALQETEILFLEDVAAEIRHEFVLCFYDFCKTYRGDDPNQRGIELVLESKGLVYRSPEEQQDAAEKILRRLELLYKRIGYQII